MSNRRIIAYLERMNYCLESGLVEEAHYMVKTELEALKRVRILDEDILLKYINRDVLCESCVEKIYNKV